MTGTPEKFLRVSAFCGSTHGSARRCGRRQLSIIQTIRCDVALTEEYLHANTVGGYDIALGGGSEQLHSQLVHCWGAKPSPAVQAAFADQQTP